MFSPEASMISDALPSCSAAILPSAIPTNGCGFAPRMSTSKSAMLRGELKDEVVKGRKRRARIARFHRLRRMMAEPAFAADEKHGDGTKAGNCDRIVAG